MMTKLQTEAYLDELENVLLNSERVPVLLTRDWVKTFKDIPAVYIFWEDGKICYVGETACLVKRVGHMLNTMNHTLRRNFGNALFKGDSRYEKPTSKKRFHSELEDRLNEEMREKFLFSYIPLFLGRLELEERIFRKHKPIYNIKGKKVERLDLE